MDVSRKFGVVAAPVGSEDMAGVSQDVRSADAWPLHGLRHPPKAHSSGWFLWVGEYEARDDFFEPVHVQHLVGWREIVEPLLSLPPGWRFLVAPGYEDVWYDEALLLIE